MTAHPDSVLSEISRAYLTEPQWLLYPHDPWRGPMSKDGRLRLFDYAVLMHPDTDEHGRAKNGAKTQLLQNDTVLAGDEQGVLMRVARGLTEDVIDDIDRVEIIIRPFD